MIPSNACIALVQRFESCRLSAYFDSRKIPTIGWGHTRGVSIGDSCTQQQADVWLAEDLSIAADGVEDSIRVALTQNQFDALCSFQFNTGGLTERQCELRDLLNAGNSMGAAAQFLRWDHQVVNVSEGLLRRRTAEMTLFSA